MNPLAVFAVALGIGAIVGLLSGHRGAERSTISEARGAEGSPSVSNMEEQVSAESHVRGAWNAEPSGSTYFVETHFADLLRWAEDDPYGLIEWAEDSGNVGLLERARKLAIAQLIKTDFDGALAYLEAAGDPMLIYRLAGEIVGAVPEDRIRDLVDLGPFNSSGASGRAYQHLQNRWIAADPDAALEALEERKGSPEYEVVGKRLFSALFHSNPSAAIERMVEESISGDVQDFADIALTSMFKLSGSSYWMHQGREAFGPRGVLKAVDEYFEGDAEKAVLWLLDRSSGTAAGAIASEYGDKGTAWLMDQIESSALWMGGKDTAYQYVFEKVGKEDPSALLELISRDPERFNNSAGAHRALREVAEARPQEMLLFLSNDSLNFSQVRGIAGSLIRFYGDENPDVVIDAITNSGREEGERQELTGLVVDMIAYDSPKTARALVSSGRVSQVGPKILNEIIYHSARKGDYLEALEWGRDFARDFPAETLVKTVAKGWSKSDPGASASWIRSMERGAEREAAIRGYAETLAEKDTVAAVEWVRSMSEGDGSF